MMWSVFRSLTLLFVLPFVINGFQIKQYKKTSYRMYMQTGDGSKKSVAILGASGYTGANAESIENIDILYILIISYRI